MQRRTMHLMPKHVKRSALIAVGRIATTRRVCEGGRDAREHGRAVDAAVTRFVREPASLRSADPCAVTLLMHVCNTLHLTPIATQVPVYSPRLRLATAIDLVAIDGAGHLFIIEIKASRMHGARSPPDVLHACYTYEAPRKRSKSLPHIPLSVYWQHQLQLWAMATTVRDEHGLALGGALVLRTTPTHAFEYWLDESLFDTERTVNAFVGT